jgi:hypothetical protein
MKPTLSEKSTKSSRSAPKTSIPTKCISKYDQA